MSCSIMWGGTCKENGGGGDGVMSGGDGVTSGGDGVTSEADLEQLVLLGPEGADVVGDVVPDHNHLPSLWVLRGEHGHPPGNHPDLGEGEGGGREGGGEYISVTQRTE